MQEQLDLLFAGTTTAWYIYIRRRLLSGRDKSSLDLGIGIFRAVSRTCKFTGIITQALFLTLRESGPMLSPGTREAHRQA